MKGDCEREEAATWVNRLDQPVIDAAMAPEFDRWIGASPTHAATFAEMQALWQSQALETALRDAAHARSASREGWRGAVGRRGALMAASLGAFCIGAFFLFDDLSMATYRTEAGARRTVMLSDGSRADLSGDTELRVRILPWRRGVTLVRGEAFFDVAHEASRPFRVDSGATTIRVLGTAFNVDRLSDTRTSVDVYRGTVRVQVADSRPLVLRKGEGTRIAGDRMAPRSHDIGETPEWKSGWFEADDVPMEVLIGQVQRYSARPIRLATPGLAAMPISGRFQVSTPRRALEAVRQAYDVDVRYGASGIDIVSNPELTPAAATR